MARLDKVGAFALTEPGHGSDSVGLETTARRDGDHWVLNGAKRWIGNGNIAHVVIVWARDVADGKVKGFVVEKDDERLESLTGYPDGYAADLITGKIGKRAIWHRHHPEQRAGAGRQQTCRGQLLPRRVQGADRDPRRGVMGSGRARRRRLRGRPHVRRPAGTVRQTHRRLTNSYRTSWPTCSPRSPPSS